MIVWLHLAGQQALQLTQDARALPYVNGSLRTLEVLQGLDPLRDSIDGEAANITITCDNRAGQCTEAFSVPPLGATATLYGVRGGVALALFVGVVERVTLSGAECRIGVVA
jgi:hypothetical protein